MADAACRSCQDEDYEALGQPPCRMCGGSRHHVDVTVRVLLLQNARDPEAVAVEMVKDALASRSAGWQMRTFVFEGDVRAASREEGAK